MLGRVLANPYLAGPPITEAHGFYGRQGLIEAVINALQTTRQNVIVLYGQRRIGKSSLLHRLRRDETLRRDHLPIFFDMQLYEGLSLPRTLTSLAQKMVDALNASIAVPSEAELAADYRQFQRFFLPKVYHHLDHKRLLILFDEFDVAVPPDTAGAVSADTFIGYLRTLIAEEQKRLVFVFVIGQRQELLIEGLDRLFKGARSERVGRLEREDTDELLIELGRQGGISYTRVTLDEIWALTNGHPYLTQLIGSTIFERLQKQQTRQASPADVEACLNRAMSDGESALNWFWRGFSPNQQWVLSAIADLTERQEIIGDAEIEQTLKQNLLAFVDESARGNSYRRLLEGDFLTTGEKEGQYQFAVEFIRRWIVKYHSIHDAKRRMEEINPAALKYYETGLTNYHSGRITEAIQCFRDALKLNDRFTLAHLDLARAYMTKHEIPKAIAAYEEAYKLDRDKAHKPLIELRLNFARELEQTGDDKAALAQAVNILNNIDSANPQARQLLADIYLRQAHKRLMKDGQLAKALNIIQNLIEPYPILEDPGVGQRVRDLWLSYSQKLCQRKPPKGDEALEVLDSLLPLGLSDETVRVTYNQIILDKTNSLLKQDKFDLALETLQNRLKPPPPNEVKELLLGYSRQQVEKRLWPQAEKTLKGLYQLLRDKQSKKALLDFYEEWINTLMNVGKFDEAIEISDRAENVGNKS